MKNLLLILPVILFVMASCKKEVKTWTYPDSKKSDVSDVYFGDTVPDPYRWLENDTAADVKEWVKEQNAVTDQYMATIPFRESLYQEFTRIWDFPKYGTPSKKGNRRFFMKNDGLQNQYVLYMQTGEEGEPEVLLDPNTFSEDGTIALSGISISNDGKYLAYKTSTGGSDWNEIRVMDIESRKMLDDHLHWIKFSGIAWLDDGFFYSAYDAPEKGSELSGKNEFHKVYFHKIGEPQSQDKLFFEDPRNPQLSVSVATDEDGKFIFLSSSQGTSGNRLMVKEAKGTNTAFHTINGDFDYDFDVVDVVDDKLLVMTNYKAPRYRLILVDPFRTEETHWQEFVPETDAVLRSASYIGGKIITTYLRDAKSMAMVYDKDGSFMHEVQFPTIGTVSGFSGDKNDNEAFYSFSSYTYPTTIYKYDVARNTSEIFHKVDVAYNPEDYETKQIFFKSKDGKEVPMFVTHRKGIPLDGKNPLLLYGYGGFNISLTPGFSVSNMPFIDNGGVYVVVNLRGGGEYGKEWHEAGTKLQKQNTFDDFISAAEWLIENKYTSSDKLAILGGSNGGLLVGACMTQRPDLFKVALPQVGVLDMLRYHKFTIGWAWAGDYGTSDESAEMYAYLKGYSPLHNIKEGVSYPANPGYHCRS